MKKVGLVEKRKRFLFQHHMHLPNSQQIVFSCLLFSFLVEKRKRLSSVAYCSCRMAAPQQIEFSLSREVTEEEFRAAVDPLAENGIPVQGWTINTIRDMRISVRTFLNSIRVLTSVKDADQRDDIIGAMISSRALNFSVPRRCTPSILFQGCNFVKSREGQNVLLRLQLQRRLQKVAAGRLTVESTGLLNVLDLQKNTMSAAIKEVRVEREHRILDLRRQLELEEQQLAQDVVTTKERFFPVCHLEELRQFEVKSRAAEMLLSEAQHMGARVPEITDALLVEAVQRYGHQIKQDHAAAFLQKQEYVEGLRTFLRETILQKERVGDVWQAERFRNTMLVVFGAGAGGGGGDHARGGLQDPDDAGRVDEPPVPVQECGDRDEEAPAPTAGRGAGKGQPVRFREELATESFRRNLRPRQRGNPSRNV